MTTPIFNGAMPIKGDVDALTRAFADRGEGDLITYAEIAGVIKVKVGTPRFIRVTNAFRDARFREHGHQIKAEPGLGLRILTPGEAVANNTKGLIATTRAVKRVAIRVEATDHTRLTPQEQGRQMLLRRQAMALGQVASETATTLEAPPRARAIETEVK